MGTRLEFLAPRGAKGGNATFSMPLELSPYEAWEQSFYFANGRNVPEAVSVCCTSDTTSSVRIRNQEETVLVRNGSSIEVPVSYTIDPKAPQFRVRITNIVDESTPNNP